MPYLSDYEYPVDVIMSGYEPNHQEAAEMIHQYRDQSLDEAEETLREESEYWHGMSEIDDEWFFTENE